jgi:hypothetical protein
LFTGLREQFEEAVETVRGQKRFLRTLRALRRNQFGLSQQRYPFAAARIIRARSSRARHHGSRTWCKNLLSRLPGLRERNLRPGWKKQPWKMNYASDGAKRRSIGCPCNRPYLLNPKPRLPTDRAIATRPADKGWQQNGSTDYGTHFALVFLARPDYIRFKPFDAP